MSRTEWSIAELARIAHLESCRELSEQARSQVSTYGEGNRRAGELVEEAHRLVRDAEDVLRLAVAAERAAGVSWEAIGEVLEIARQSAHERYAQAVDRILDGILFPTRESERGGPGWWACPDGLEDPDKTLARLDGWAARRREPTDPERGSAPVSAELRRRREKTAGIEAIGTVTRLARRVAQGDLPDGVTERAARRILLEHKVRAFDLIAERDTGANATKARGQSSEAYEQLIAWHREDLEQRITAGPIGFEIRDLASGGQIAEGSWFLLDGRPIAELGFSAEGSTEDTGWLLWDIDADAYDRAPDDMWDWLGDPWPLDVAGVDVDELVALGERDGVPDLRRAAGETAARTRSTALLQAHKQLVQQFAIERAKRSVNYLEISPAS